MTTDNVERQLRRRLSALRLGERAVREEVHLHRYEIAVAQAELAAQLASQRHPGRFASVALEWSLEAIGHRTMSTAAAGARRGHGRQRVLHVSTRTVGLGGHTQWVRRIIEADTSRAHSLALTGPATEPLPADLDAALARSGGGAYRLASGPGGKIERARRLRALAGDFDLVVLSTDPADAVPSVAFASWHGGPPVARLNHADHIFWIGAAVSDVLIEFRPVGRAFSERRRGYPAGREALLRLPVDPPVRLDKAEARRRLGLDDGVFVVTSIGAKYKFEAYRGAGYLDVVAPALEQIPALTVVVVGPVATGEWSAAVRRFGRRLQVHAPTKDLAPYFSAADAFLNPTPIGSDTVLWEAAAAGLPIVSMRPEVPDLELIQGDPAELDGVALVPTGSVGLTASIGELIDSPAMRTELGAAAAAKVLSERVGEAWLSHLETVLTAALQASPMTAGELVECDFREEVDGYVASWASVGSLPKAVLRRAQKVVRRSGAS